MELISISPAKAFMMCVTLDAILSEALTHVSSLVSSFSYRRVSTIPAMKSSADLTPSAKSLSYSPIVSDAK